MISKNDILDYYFGDTARYLLKEYRISLAIIPCVALCVMVYFIVIRKHKKGDKYTIKEKIYLGGAIWMILLTIMLQILASMGWGR